MLIYVRNPEMIIILMERSRSVLLRRMMRTSFYDKVNEQLIELLGNLAGKGISPG